MRLKGATLDSSSTDVCISTDPTLDAAAMQSVSLVFTQLIAYFFSGTQPAPRVFDFPLQKGESVYFSADASCVVTLFYDDLQLS